MTKEMREKIEAQALEEFPPDFGHEEFDFNYVARSQFTFGATFICENYAVIEKDLLDDVVEFMVSIDYFKTGSRTFSKREQLLSKLRKARGKSE